MIVAPIVVTVIASTVPLSDGVRRLGDLSKIHEAQEITRGFRLFRAGQHASAEPILRRALDRLPELADHFNAALGDIAWSAKRIDEARTHYARVRPLSLPFARVCFKAKKLGVKCRLLRTEGYGAELRAADAERRRLYRSGAFEAVVSDHPFSFLAHRARQATQRRHRTVALLTSVGATPFMPLPSSTASATPDPPEPSFAPAAFSDPRIEAGVGWLRLSHRDEALREFRAVELDVRPSEATFIHLARIYADMGDTRRAHWALRLRTISLPRMRDKALRERLLQIAYPRRHVKEIESSANEYGLPTSLFYSLIREESSFNPRAVSVSDALGLTQLLIATAGDMARAVGITKRITRTALFEPRLNTRLGARFLAWLIRYYEGRVPLAVAAYNAGQGTVDRWLRVRRVPGRKIVHPSVNLDRFVDSIPFADTRLYVQRVLGGSEAYTQLYGATPTADLHDGVTVEKYGSDR
ncbi:MAG: transglycosylase SLT domain-containing protein [Deltaproteobacteria bacterium]|nr:transglycosylase SLT domain-containing protein [Deltaproteobacteria bacterium]